MVRLNRIFKTAGYVIYDKKIVFFNMYKNVKPKRETEREIERLEKLDIDELEIERI